MGKRIAYIFLIFVLLSLHLGLDADAFYAGRKRATRFPAPRIISPVKEEVDLSEKDKLVFKWGPHRGGTVALIYFDFRIYKGYDMTEPHLIYKERLPARQNHIEISADTFDSGETYTWSIRYKNKDGTDSSRNYHSFSIYFSVYSIIIIIRSFSFCHSS